MPELAEVETLKRYLASHIIGDKITNLTKRRNKLRYEITEDLFNYLINTTIIDLTRRAKYLNIYLDNSYVLIFHLGMSGRITIQQQSDHLQKHDHVIIGFQSGKQLVFNDARRFGMVYISHINQISDQHYLKTLGVEPLNKEFDAEYLFKKPLLYNNPEYMLFFNDFFKQKVIDFSMTKAGAPMAFQINDRGSFSGTMEVLKMKC